MGAACSGSATEWCEGTASPPAERISSTTASAALAEPPVPSTAPPMSLTTTRAPRRASSRAYWRPRPPPAPVTIATRPSKLIGASDIHRLDLLGVTFQHHPAPQLERGGHLAGLGGPLVGKDKVLFHLLGP